MCIDAARANGAFVPDASARVCGHAPRWRRGIRGSTRKCSSTKRKTRRTNRIGGSWSARRCGRSRNIFFRRSRRTCMGVEELSIGRRWFSIRKKSRRSDKHVRAMFAQYRLTLPEERARDSGPLHDRGHREENCGRGQRWHAVRCGVADGERARSAVFCSLRKRGLRCWRNMRERAGTKIRASAW